MPQTITADKTVREISQLIRTARVKNVRMIPLGLSGPANPINGVSVRKTRATVEFADDERDYGLDHVIHVAWEEPTPEERREASIEALETGIRWRCEGVLTAWDGLMQKTREASEKRSSERQFGWSLLGSLTELAPRAQVAREVLEALDTDVEGRSQVERLQALRDYARPHARLTHVPQSTSQISNLQTLEYVAAWAEISRYLEVDVLR